MDDRGTGFARIKRSGQAATGTEKSCHNITELFTFSPPYLHPPPPALRAADRAGSTCPGHRKQSPVFSFTQPQYEAFSRTPAQTFATWTASHPAHDFQSGRQRFSWYVAFRYLLLCHPGFFSCRLEHGPYFEVLIPGFIALCEFRITGPCVP